ncbi:MAG: hypothetical protein CBB67_021135 [Alteromonadaceae bacterium TMED7]|nr:hypothetical protein [Alteromonadaceae bacterium]RPH13245.1 MAG: hypothetical protein CBB67_021135 [Alteromonadaceae bacterium TMED7]|tara:strand:- start:1497 stop:1679 length:183 start_codon:yes stop_codon:yes gene_type:complete
MTPDRPGGPSEDKMNDEFKQKTVKRIPDKYFVLSGITNAILFRLVNLLRRSRIAPVALPG